MTKCMTKDCPHEAKWAPKINVPAVGWDIDKHQPLVAVMALELCEKCIVEFTPDSFFGEEVSKEKGNMRQLFTLMTHGKQPPDFERAWISHISIESKEFHEVKNSMAKTEGSDEQG